MRSVSNLYLAWIIGVLQQMSVLDHDFRVQAQWLYRSVTFTSHNAWIRHTPELWPGLSGLRQWRTLYSQQAPADVMLKKMAVCKIWWTDERILVQIGTAWATFSLCHSFSGCKDMALMVLSLSGPFQLELLKDLDGIRPKLVRCRWTWWAKWANR
jgi:hypothetical protein